MLYVLIKTELAAPLSRGIFDIMLPPALRDEHYVTRQYCDWVVSSADPTWSVLLLPENETIPMHIHADLTRLQQVLTVFVQDGAITPEEAAGIGQGVGAAAGQPVPVTSFIPPSWQPYVMTLEAAIAAGFPLAPAGEPDGENDLPPE